MSGAPGPVSQECLDKPRSFAVGPAGVQGRVTMWRMASRRSAFAKRPERWALPVSVSPRRAWMRGTRHRRRRAKGSRWWRSCAPPSHPPADPKRGLARLRGLMAARNLRRAQAPDPSGKDPFSTVKRQADIPLRGVHSCGSSVDVWRLQPEHAPGEQCQKKRQSGLRPSDGASRGARTR